MEFAPNTKLQGTKVTKALHAIYLNKNLQVDTKHGKVEDALDNMSTSLRIVMSMLRQVKTNESTKTKVCRQLSREQVGKLNLVLKEVILPDECFDRGYQSENDDSQEQLDLQPDIKPLADVDLTLEVPPYRRGHQPISRREVPEEAREVPKEAREVPKEARQKKKAKTTRLPRPPWKL